MITGSITLLTTDFRDSVVSAATWEALFIVLIVISFLWFCWSLKYLRASPTVHDVVNELKADSPVPARGEQLLLS
jgi:hypothetical protein